MDECPECGKEELETIDLPDYNEGVVERTKSCWNTECDYRKEDIELRPTNTNDKKECRICGSEFMPEHTGDKFCNHCDDNKIVQNVYAHNFGILIPKETGVVYTQQTAGVLCHQVHIEGSYVPLRRPTENGDDIKPLYKFENEYRTDGDMLKALRKANYNHNNDKVKEIWEDIREKLSFSLEWVAPPKKRHPKNQEGIRWAKITGRPEEYPTLDEKLVGETICLVYPNCD